MRVPHPLLRSAAVAFPLALAALPCAAQRAAPHGARASAPALHFSTYLGGSGIEAGQAAAFDGDGNLYVAGHTASADFPAAGAVRPHRGGTLLGLDVFVVKLSPTGALLYAAFLGGSGDDLAAALAVDGLGRAYVAGGTSSPDFPATAGALHAYRDGPLLGSDGFVARLSADGSSIEYATCLGGTGDESVGGIALDAQGRVYLAGTTASADFPVTAGALQAAAGGGLALGADAFAVRLRPDGGGGLALDYATYLGGSFDETGAAVGADADGRAYLAGYTASTDFPTARPVRPAFAGPMRDFEGDAYLARLSADGRALDFSTYLGGRLDDQASALALGSGGLVHVAGRTRSADFPATPGAYQPQRRGAEDAFLATFDADAGRLLYATYLGGSGADRAYGVSLDADGRILLGGVTDSPDFPAVDAPAAVAGGGAADGFLVRLEPDGAGPGFSTLFGGGGLEAAAALAAGAEGTACLTGGTGSGDYPLHAALQAAFPGAAAGSGILESAFVTCFGEAAGVGNDAPQEAPVAFALHPNYPNPFNPATTIRFDVPVFTRVRLTVYDLQGRRVATVVDADFAPGRYAVPLDARGWASGLYLYAVETARFRATRTMVLLK